MKKKNKREGPADRLYSYDIETYPNLFTFVAKDYYAGDYKRFYISEYGGGWCDKKGKLVDPEQELLFSFDDFIEFVFDAKRWFVGFNNIGFDGQVMQKIMEIGPSVTARQIYAFSQDVIESEWPPYREKSLEMNQMDLFKMWSFDNSARRTSLKWLEFTMRSKGIKDLPYPFDKDITEKQIPKVVKYNDYDVDKTEALLDISFGKIELRKEIMKSYNNDTSFLNLGDTNLGAKMFLHDLADDMGIPAKELNKKRTDPKTIHVDDLILPYIEFESEEFSEILDFYRDVSVTMEDDGYVKLKGVISNKVEFKGLEYVYGAGGLHASMSNKIVKAKKGYRIIDVDVKSYYPNLAIVNGWFPSHLSKKFCERYKEMYDKRASIPKSNPWNLAYKLGLNAVFGKSNSKYSYLYDPEFTLSITINGQLLLSMLCEWLNDIGTVIQANTDGVSVLIKDEDYGSLQEIKEEWMEMTGLILEEDEYKQMAMRDVNNYHAIFVDGSVKRKGAYEIYDDVVGNEAYHKNPSGSVIPSMVDMYYTEGTPPNESIEGFDNFHDFMFGFKKKSNFEFLLLNAKENGFVDIDRNSDRVLRYYVSKEGFSAYKQYLSGKNLGSITTLLKDKLITPNQYARTIKPHLYEDLDVNYYIKEAQDMIDSLENYQY